MVGLIKCKVDSCGQMLEYYLGRAAADTPSSSLVILIHGRSRSATSLAMAFTLEGEGRGFTVLAPVFDVSNFNRFHLLSGLGGPYAASDALDAACDDLTEKLEVTFPRVAIIGFSAGAQFAHRYAMRHPRRISSLVSASAGWYTMPDASKNFPYGIAPSRNFPERIDALDAFLSIPMKVMVGDRDVQRDRQLRTSPSLDRTQGSHRLARAKRWVDSIRDTAISRSIRPNISLEILPNTAHSVDEALRFGGFAQRALNFVSACEVDQPPL